MLIYLRYTRTSICHHNNTFVFQLNLDFDFYHATFYIHKVQYFSNKNENLICYIAIYIYIKSRRKAILYSIS